ncbi:MAG: Sec-independent protein translocase protein TatB [Thermodesulfobacteriota bacterium]|nr:Sec-independent protein translocase protein TatB [Thermodesulfobacteriota bacterium]
MFGIGTTELLVILLVALVVLGPKKLPQIARSLGKALGEFKRVSSDVKSKIDLEVENLEREEKTQKAKSELLPEDYAAETAAASAAPDAATGGATAGPAAASADDAEAANAEVEDSAAPTEAGRESKDPAEKT